MFVQGVRTRDPDRCTVPEVLMEGGGVDGGHSQLLLVLLELDLNVLSLFPDGSVQTVSWVARFPTHAKGFLSDSAGA